MRLPFFIKLSTRGLILGRAVADLCLPQKSELMTPNFRYLTGNFKHSLILALVCLSPVQFEREGEGAGGLAAIGRTRARACPWPSEGLTVCIGT